MKEEIELLKKLRFNGKRAHSQLLLQELQSLRDPLHFVRKDRPAMQNWRENGLLTGNEASARRHEAVKAIWTETNSGFCLAFHSFRLFRYLVVNDLDSRAR